MNYILSLLVFLPLIGMLFVFNIKNGDARTARNALNVRLIVSVTEVLLCFTLFLFFDKDIKSLQFVERFAWIENLYYALGINGTSILMIAVATLFFLFLNVFDRISKIKMPKEYSFFILWLEAMLLGLFCAANVFTFNFFFIGLCFPFMFLLKLWGLPVNMQEKGLPVSTLILFLAAISAGVLVMSITILGLTEDSFILAGGAGNLEIELEKDIMWLYALLLPVAFLFVGYAIPLLTASSGISPNTPYSTFLLCVCAPFMAGFYGISQLILPLGREGLSFFYVTFIFFFMAMFIFFAIKSFAQKDLRKIIGCYVGAYLSLCFIGLFLNDKEALNGAVLFALNFVPVLMAFVLCIAVIYARTGNTHIFDISGLIHLMPRFTNLFFIAVIAGISAPLTGGFSGLLLMASGAFEHSFIITLFLILSIVVIGAFLIYTYQNMAFGVPPEKILDINDISYSQGAWLLVILGFSFGLGLFPDWFIGFLK